MQHRRWKAASRRRGFALVAAIIALGSALVGCADGADPNPVGTLNEILADEVPTWSTNTSTVSVVDMYSWFDPDEYSLDGIHPNPAGEDQMAARWVEAITAVVGPPTDQPLAVMPLGDSITDDFQRYQTWRRLIEAGYRVDFVGTQNSLPSSIGGEAPPVQGWTFDADHEGHAGWAASEMLTGSPTEPAAGRLVDWLDGADADVVLLHIGTNDIIRLRARPGLVAARISRIVFELQLAMPDVTVLVAQITPLGNGVENA